MPINRELIRAIAREMHGRTDIEEAVLQETAERLGMLMDKARLADERGLQAVAPAFSFDPGAETYRTKPQVGPSLWEGIGRAGGGSGYGGAKGTTGVAAPERAAPPKAKPGPEYLYWSAADLAAAIRRKYLSPVEVTRAFLDRIADVDKSINAFVTVLADDALEQARRAEAAEPAGPLHGVPVALKDIYETAGIRTTAGSRILADHVPQRDATSVRLLREAGAIIIGKTATHEFAFGALTDSPYHGPVRNPWDLSRIPGGSSGGSGAAVAAGMAPVAMGTDTGGSIRMPASCCGVVGLKPTYGRVSKAGVLPLSWSLDHVGPLARTVRDCALVLGAIAGPDPLDPSALPVPADDYAAAAANPGDLKGVTVGVPEGWLDRQVDSEVQAAFEAAMQRLQDLGARIVEVELPSADVMTFLNRLITFGEAGAFHATFIRERAADYAPDVRLRMEVGQYITARDYLIGQRLRGEVARQAHQVMQKVDVIATPTMPIPPAFIGQPLWDLGGGKSIAVVEAMVRFPAPFSVTGQPAISLPCGLTPSGVPIGLQLVGRAFREVELVRISAAFEAAGSAWSPPL